MACCGTIEGVRALSLEGEFDQISDAAILAKIGQARCFVCEESFGGCCDLATELVAAHFITVALRGADGPSGPVTSESAAGVTRTFGGISGTSSESHFASTAYGLQFLELKKGILRPMLIC